jgi:RimJ/RimL family protein N-acetyltransferase
MIKIELQPFERSDFARLISWVTSEEEVLVWGGMIFHYPLDEFQLEKYLQAAETDQPARKIFKAVETRTNEAVGHIELDQIDRRNRSARISRVLVGEPSLRRKGIGSQMVRKVLQIGFDELGLHRLMLTVLEVNVTAISCYEKIGFVREGLLRDVLKVGDGYWSACVMSVLESEWRAQQIK